jgi:hypothetical protein
MQLVILLLSLVVVIVPFWRLIGRLGYSPFLSLLLLLPFVNLGLLYYIAFSDWPIQVDSPRLEDEAGD